VLDVGEKNWKILAYLKNAINVSLKEIEKPMDREDLIDEVLKIRDIKRAQLTLQHILEKDEEPQK
jgi:hypothetical protein